MAAAVLPLDPAQALSDRHFVMQDARPDWLTDVAVRDLAPELRTLLVTDGTVTRVLEAQALAPISVEVVSQGAAPTPSALGPPQATAHESGATMRRVLLLVGEPPRPVVWAESFIAYSRLPAGFSSVLSDSRQGIGEALATGRLETRRELLWYGVASSPAWTAQRGFPDTTLVRAYRVLTRGVSALLILEGFAVERQRGSYVLRAPP